jgi:hypothetical protein
LSKIINLNGSIKYYECDLFYGNKHNSINWRAKVKIFNCIKCNKEKVIITTDIHIREVEDMVIDRIKCKLEYKGIIGGKK